MNALWLNIAGGTSIAVSATLTLLAGQAWRRSGSVKHALLALSFFSFLVVSVVSAWWMFSREDLEALILVQWGGSTLSMLLLYLATVKR